MFKGMGCLYCGLFSSHIVLSVIFVVTIILCNARFGCLVI